MNQSELRLQQERHVKLEHVLCGGLNVDATETEGREASRLHGLIYYLGCWKGLDLQLHARWGGGGPRSNQAFLERVPPLFLLQFQRGGGTVPFLPLMSDRSLVKSFPQPWGRLSLCCLRMDLEAMVWGQGNGTSSRVAAG